eukprot:12184_1
MAEEESRESVATHQTKILEDLNELSTRTDALSKKTDSNSFKTAAKSLDKQRKIDKLKQWQEVEDVDENELYSSGIKKHKGMADRLQATASSLETEMNRDSLNRVMGQRTEESVLYSSGIKSNPTIASSLQATARALEKEIQTDSLNRGISGRMEENAFYNSGIAGMKGVAHSLQATAKSLEKQKKVDKLKQWQEVENVDENELYSSGIKKYRGMADSLHPTVASLEKEILSDSLNQRMNARADKSDLYDQGIMKEKGISNALQPNAQQLQQQQIRDKLAHKIRERSDSNKFGMRGVANALQATAKTLEKQKKIDKLKQWQEVEDVDEEQLYAAGIKKHRGMAASLQPSADALQKEQRKDVLRAQMKKMRAQEGTAARYDDAEIEQETQNIIDSLSEDELNALRATLQRDIGNKNDAIDPQIYVYLNRLIGSRATHDEEEQLPPESPNTQQTMNDIFAEHEQEQQLNHVDMNAAIARRPPLQSLKEHNILKADAAVASNSHATSDRLEQEQIRDKIKKGMRSRTESYQLTSSGILQSRVQSAANALEKQRYRDKLKSDFSQRSSAEDLERKGIMFSSNIAHSLQPNAARLESQLVRLRSAHAKEMKTLRAVITHKDEEIQGMIDAQHALDHEEDHNYKRLLLILRDINTEIASFELNCNCAMIDRVAEANIDGVVNANSALNHKLNKYRQMAHAIAMSATKFTDSIDTIAEYMRDKYVPRKADYKTWTVDDIILWCKSLDNGQFMKHLGALRQGFIESSIRTGELLPDLSVGDLSVTPFNIKSFADKRALIGHFKTLPSHEDDDDDDELPQLMGHKTEQVVESYIAEQKEKQLYGEYYLIRRDILETLSDPQFDDGSWGPILVRLAWHASGTFDASDGSGGCSGASMRFYPEIADPENAGLDLARERLAAIKAKYDDVISYADLWIFASYVAIEAMGGPYIKFRGGRSDDKAKSLCPANGRLPSAEGDAAHIRSVFNRMGFNDEEIVALIGGGHVLGRCHKDRSGYDGPWVDNPTQFSNEYFEELFENKWQQKVIKQTGKTQFRDEKDELMMLPADMVMMSDPQFRKWTQIYYNDKQSFFEHFAAAYKKLTELGCFEQPKLEQKHKEEEEEDQYVD